jgi:predicted RNA-binding Zn-ribbon protein involved in translation (DUF1610 family)
MTTVDDLKTKAEMVKAFITCPECDFEEPFALYLNREDRVDEEGKEVTFGCPDCGNDSVDLGQRTPTAPTILVHGIEEMEELTGQ